MDNDKTTTVEEAFLDALDVLWRQHGNDDPCYKAMLPFAKQIAELQAEADEQARLNGMGAEREARLMAQVAELRAERDALAKDAGRLDWLWRDSRVEGFTNVAGDVYDYAQDEAIDNGRDEPSEADYSAGFRKLIDAAMAEGER